MRLLYVINSLDTVGGAEKVACLLSDRLATKHGYRVHIAYVWKGTNPTIKAWKPMRLPLVHQLDAAGVTHKWLGKRPHSKLQGIWTAHRNLREIIRDFKPNIIHSHCFHPDFFSALQANSTLSVRTLHSERTASKFRSFLMEKVSAHRFKATIVLCSSLKERWEKRYRKKNWPVHIIPNPVSDCFFENSRPRAIAPQPPYQLGIVGRLSPEKGHTYAMQSLEILAQQIPLELHIAGGGILYEPLLAQAKSLKYLKLHFLGSLTEAEIRKLYDHLDLLLVPSLFEGFPLTVIEAMATGLPIVGTNVTGVCDVLEACGRRPIPIEDGPSLVTEVQTLLEDKAEYCRFSAAAIQAVQICRAEEVLEAHHQLYKQLLHQKAIHA